MNKQRAKEVIDYLEKHGFVYPAWYLTRKKNPRRALRSMTLYSTVAELVDAISYIL